MARPSPRLTSFTLPEQVISAELHIVGALAPETVTSTALLTVSFLFIAMLLSLVISTLPVQVIFALPVIAGAEADVVTEISVAPLTVRLPQTAI